MFLGRKGRCLSAFGLPANDKQKLQRRQNSDTIRSLKRQQITVVADNGFNPSREGTGKVGVIFDVTRALLSRLRRMDKIRHGKKPIQRGLRIELGPFRLQNRGNSPLVFLPNFSCGTSAQLSVCNQSQTTPGIPLPANGRQQHTAIENDPYHLLFFDPSCCRASRTSASTSCSISSVISSWGSSDMILSNCATLGPISSRAKARRPARTTSLAFPYCPERIRDSMNLFISCGSETFNVVTATSSNGCC